VRPPNAAERVCGMGDWSSDRNWDTNFSGRLSERCRDETTARSRGARAAHHGNALQAKFVEIKETFYRMLQMPVSEQGRWLGQVVHQCLAYHAVPTNARAITFFVYYVTWHCEAGPRASQPRRAGELGSGAMAAARPGLSKASSSNTKVGAECVSRARSDLSGR
jgi:hypothetical protein